MRFVTLALLVAGCGGHGSTPINACAGLSLADCRLTDGCKADMCNGCFCDLGYRGCLGELAVPEDCPQLGCPGAACCTTEEQCQGQGSCAQPGTPQGCGSCNTFPSTCVDDDSCGGTMICEPIPCSCDGNLQCVAGCTSDVECAVGTTCDVASSRCVATACAGDDCPPDFDCVGGACARRSCTDDFDCDGFCVVGACFTGALGECRLPVP
jgi:hypothetical protein